MSMIQYSQRIENTVVVDNVTDNILYVSYEVNERADEFFVEKKVFKKYFNKNNLASVCSIPFSEIYYLRSQEYVDAIYEIPEFMDDRGGLRNSVEKVDVANLRDINPSRLIKDAVCYDGFYYQIGREYPLAGALYVDYIGGITNRYYDLDKAKKALDKSKYVSSVEMSDIPYYNAERDYNRCIQYIVTPPQQVQDDMMDYFRKKLSKENPYWILQVIDCIKSPGDLLYYMSKKEVAKRGFDFLNLLPYYRESERSR